MGSQRFQPLPGFRDSYPADCAVRTYLCEHWRGVAGRYGFVEFEGPLLEPTDLYRRKSGDEITAQLFHFTDKGEREVSLRPEVTPSLARMVTARSRDFRKPLKWFQIGPCFRYEKQQKGRSREFYQFNCDILGEGSVAADAELVALVADLMRGLGFTPDDVEIRVSDRDAWLRFAETEGVSADQGQAFLAAVDKLEREKPEATDAKLRTLGTSLAAVEGFITKPATASPKFDALLADLGARGLDGFVRLDLGVVRGLAYYTGLVFEVFSLGEGMRAVAGGGRYDGLCELVGGAGAAMPACGFAMGDVVIADLVRATPQASSRLTHYLSGAFALDAYVVVADEGYRPQALGLVQKLRAAGFRADFPLSPTKVGKQFQAAESVQARLAVVVGAGFPKLQVKHLATRAPGRGPPAGSAADRLRALPRGSNREDFLTCSEPTTATNSAVRTSAIPLPWSAGSTPSATTMEWYSSTSGTARG
jgi:histidyl-tRNA synthetase